MTCKYCGDSHSAFDPCPESIRALTTADSDIKYSPHRIESTAAPSKPEAPSGTTRTDKQTLAYVEANGIYPTRFYEHRSGEYVSAAFARQLERELSAAQAENAAMRGAVERRQKDIRLIEQLASWEPRISNKIRELFPNDFIGETLE